MTTGFLVDQELNVVELKLPADNGSGSGVVFRALPMGENGMRTIRTMTKTVNGKETVSYMDLDLETLTIQSHQIRMNRISIEHLLGVMVLSIPRRVAT